MDTMQETFYKKDLRSKVRYFNRKYFNPFALSFAGRPKSFWSVIQHTGRRSGKMYVTPIVAAHQKGGFVIPLPYGRGVDWYRNVMAAGGCLLIYQGEVYQTSEPQVIPLAEGLGIFSDRVQGHLRRSDTEDCLRLKEISVAPNSETLYQTFTHSYPLSRGLWTLAAFGFLTIGMMRLFGRRKCLCWGSS